MNKATKANTITFNGHLYDARTGQPLHQRSTSHFRRQDNASKQRTVDGITRRQASTSPTKGRQQTVQSPAASHAKEQIIHPKHAPHQKAAHAHAIHQRTTRPNTLMRTTVKKPAASKIHSLNSPLLSNSNLEISAPSSLEHSADRIIHAPRVAKSKLISRFNIVEAPAVAKTHASSLTVRPHPEESPATAPHLATDPPAARISAATEMFEAAMNKADSHKQKSIPHSHRSKLGISRKARNVGAITAASVLIIGFIVIHNTPNLSMKLASSRADVHGSLPAYRLSGFSMQRPAYTQGEIVLNFHSNNHDNRNFTVVQKSAPGLPYDLEQQFLQQQSVAYQRHEQNGRTIYLYGDNNATWVENSTWYDLRGDAQLTADQVLKFAASF